MTEPTPEFLAQMKGVEDRQRERAAASGTLPEYKAAASELANQIVAGMSAETRAKYEAAQKNQKNTKK